MVSWTNLEAEVVRTGACDIYIVSSVCSVFSSFPQKSPVSQRKILTSKAVLNLFYHCLYPSTCILLISSLSNLVSFPKTPILQIFFVLIVPTPSIKSPACDKDPTQTPTVYRKTCLPPFLKLPYCHLQKFYPKKHLPLNCPVQVFQLFDSPRVSTIVVGVLQKV